MREPCVVGVPPSDLDELLALAGLLEVEISPMEHRYFDGAAFVEAILPLVFSGTALATFRTWIRARAEVRKATRVTFKGLEITATKPADVERIVRLLAEMGSEEPRDDHRSS